MAVLDRSILVLYGSETGNAQDLAEEMGRLCQRLRFQSLVQELDAVDLPALVSHRLVIFVISTSGQGDLPRNALLFWRKLLRKKLPPGCLSQLSFTCFGLGDSTYVNFNWAARKLVRRLQQLGATTFFDPCEADEQFPEGIDGSFIRWADELRSHLVEHHPHPHGLPPLPDDENLPPRWSLEPALRRAEEKQEEKAGSSMERPPPPLSDLVPIPDGWKATLVDSERMTPDTHWQDVRLLSLDVASRGPGQRLRCNPGDCLTIYPQNAMEEADKLIGLMGWESVSEKPLDLSLCQPLPPGLLVPSPTAHRTLRDLVVQSVDLSAVPRRSFLRAMSYYSSDPDQRDRLMELTTTEFLDDYFDYATRSRRSVLEVLDDFRSVRVPAHRLLDVFPLIRGRDFSIANYNSSSSDNDDNTRVELVVAMVRYRTILRKPREGLCSRYLARLTPPTSRLSVSHRAVSSPVHGAEASARPLIAMATGTGIAPVRSLILERLSHHDDDGSNQTPTPTIVFFGNRSKESDFLFSKEWQSLCRQKLVTLYTAFSRDQPRKLLLY
ncbi:hypothetical protein L249_8972 [Ophiocordyceps polyrhachis-furcata BCC 54312]|uniref:NADPH-dependent FMN and FAD-containing oxidoreductase n=1 Tax=Ophiocordyceps polyrhachis-furcata BCC 54312 TaxID=1330021 RepID=A0A367L1V6_9HYPO|nr:hypothetical protein L249_8972 [Ophiocordyceps polyrhachis-furcata BCC 54312]